MHLKLASTRCGVEAMKLLLNECVYECVCMCVCECAPINFGVSQLAEAGAGDDDDVDHTRGKC